MRGTKALFTLLITTSFAAAACQAPSGKSSHTEGNDNPTTGSPPGPSSTDDDPPVCEPYQPGPEEALSHLRGWWPLDAGGGDQSDYGNDCTFVGDAQLVDDPERGSVVALDGDGDYLDCGNDATLDLAGTLTLSMWIRVGSLAVPWQSFISRNGEQCGWNLRRDEQNAGADFALRGTAAVDDLRGTRPLDDGQWHHLAGVFSGSTRTLYVDGEIDSELPDSGAIASCPADHVLIGAMGSESSGYGHNSHHGWIDEVRVYDTALDAQTIRVLAGQGQVAHSPSPAAGAHCVEPGAALSWEPGLGACAHHIYLGTGEAAVATADDPESLPGQGEQLDGSFNPAGLSHQTHYFWRIDEVTAEGIERGPVWSFRTCGEQQDGFVLVSAGSFTMGQSPGDTEGCMSGCGWPFAIEKPHDVVITRDFWMQATEVTQGQWASITGENPSVFAACGQECPVENVTWWQMVAYCNLRSVQEGLTPCYYADAAGTQAYDMAAGNGHVHPHWIEGLACEGYRLPTEAEWEYAARAGTTTPTFLGAASDANVQQLAWYGPNSSCSYAGCEQENCRDAVGIPPSGTHPVGERLPNDWGLYDTGGNVWELVWDHFGEYHDGPVTDPTGPVAHTAGFHVARGGSWLNGTVEARVSTRDGDDSTCDPDNGPGPHTGFRIARTAP